MEKEKENMNRKSKIAMTKIIRVVVISLFILSAVMSLAACGGKKGGIPSGKYVFYNTTFGNQCVDETDTIDTVKSKLLAEFPELDWDWELPSGKTRLDFIADIILSGITLMNFIQINGKRMVTEIGDPMKPVVRNEEYRVVDSKIQVYRDFAPEVFRHLWTSTDFCYDSDTEIIYLENWRSDLNCLVRISYKVSPL